MRREGSNASHWPSAVCDWFAELFRERFGVQLALHATAAGTMLAPEGGTGVTLPALHDRFVAGNRDLPCGRWHGEREGWRIPLGSPLPAPGRADFVAPLLRTVAGGAHLDYDIVGLAFWMLSRAEEVGCEALDEHGRFAASESHACRHGYLERPLVDEWLEVLAQVLQRLNPGLSLRAPSFRLEVSHDVDEPSRVAFGGLRRAVRAAAGDLLRECDPRALLLLPAIRRTAGRQLHRLDPDNTFDWLMAQSERRGLISTFHFICGRTQPQRDALYEPEAPAIGRLLREIDARGHAIGLHPSYGSSMIDGQIAIEADRLRATLAALGIAQPLQRARMHYLRWRMPSTLWQLESAGIRRDATLGYADRVGFRCGTGFEYTAIDPVEERPLGLRIQPLVAMECTVMRDRYMGLGDGERALDCFLRLKAACRRVGGTFSLLWHNSELRTRRRRDLYAAILDG